MEELKRRPVSPHLDEFCEDACADEELSGGLRWEFFLYQVR